MGPTVSVYFIYFYIGQIDFSVIFIYLFFASQETLSLQKQVPGMRKGEGVIAQTFLTPSHSLCLFPQGYHFSVCLHPLSCVPFYFLPWPGRFFCLGLPTSPKGSFQHCSELINILLVPENALPVLLFNVPFSASLIITLHTFCSHR